MTDADVDSTSLDSSAERFLASHADPRKVPVLADGTLIGDWRIAAFLGRGGSGEVYRVVKDTGNSACDSGKSAALKLLIREGDTARSRFLRETALFAQMDNPAFPRFFAKGEIGGRPYLIMELLEPRTLPSSDAKVANFLLKLCDGVDALHHMGYVHRDIKPQNILWRTTTSVPVLIDLGLAKDTTREHDAVGTSLTLVDGHAAGVGTPGYAAPEQLVGDAISPATDIHALGMLARECFGGKPPRAWERVIRRAVSSVPAYRYPDVAAFAHAIRHRHWRRNWLVCVIFLAAACGIASASFLLRTQPVPSSSSSLSPLPSTSRQSSNIAEHRQRLVREINEKLQTSRRYASMGSQKMDDIADSTERLSTTTNKEDRTALLAHIRRLQSELNEFTRLQIAATNGIDRLKNELKAMSDSEPMPQVPR